MGKKKSIAYALSSMVNNPKFSDIKLEFEQENKILFAHKMMLSVKSDVFDRIFSGSMATTNETIKIKECNSFEFLEILRFCYTDRVELNQNNVAGIIAAANYYCISDLEEHCCDFVIKYLCPKNVCKIYEENYRFCNKLTDKCLRLFDDNISEIMHQDDFMALSKEPLLTILSRDALAADEFQLFVAVQNISVEFKAEALKMIRYATMSISEFAQCCEIDGSILTAKCIADVRHYIEMGHAALQFPFSTVKREIYVDAELAFPNDDYENVTLYGHNQKGFRKRMNVTVTEKIKISGIDFVGTLENCLECVWCLDNIKNLINYGIELSTLNGAMIFKSESVDTFVRCTEPILLVPDVQYILTSSVSWSVSNFSELGFKNYYCDFKTKIVMDDEYMIYDDDDDDGGTGPFKITCYKRTFETFISKIHYKMLK